ncbi:hypothetical protein BH10CYA1_BH10CYA1_14330 [soil metagenome]
MKTGFSFTRTVAASALLVCTVTECAGANLTAVPTSGQGYSGSQHANAAFNRAGKRSAADHSLSDFVQTRTPVFTPRLPDSLPLNVEQLMLAATVSRDYRNYFHFAVLQDLNKAPCNRSDDKIKPWTTEEKADLERILKVIAMRSPGLLISAAHGGKVTLCRIGHCEHGTAYASVQLVALTDNFFKSANQYHIVCHELIHLCDAGYRISDSPDWRLLIHPSSEQAKQRCRNFDWFAANAEYRKFGLASVYASKNDREALAENAARYLTTGDALGGSRFLSEIMPQVIAPSQHDLVFRQHYDQANLLCMDHKTTQRC